MDVYACMYVFVCVAECWLWCRYSVGVRGGGTAAAATEWVSESSVVCKLSGGAGGSVGVVVSGGARGGSMSAGVSYDEAGVSGVGVRNTGGAAGGSVSVSGAELGRSR